MSLQDYVKRLWNHSNTKIPITIGKGTDTAKPRSKAPQGGAMTHIYGYVWLSYVGYTYLCWTNMIPDKNE